MPRTAPIPLRDEEVVALGRATRIRYADCSIEEVARHESIILEIASFGELKCGGISVCQSIDTFYLFESLVDDGRFIESRYPVAERVIKFIALARDHTVSGHRITLEEIFWHEYFHMNWSPELQPYDPALHEYSTHGVLDKQDERRADLFAASVLIEAIHPTDTSTSIAQRFAVSRHLATLAIQTERTKRLFSRDWTPVF